MTIPSQVEQFVRNIREKLPNYSSPERCAEVLKEETINIIGFLPDNVAENIDAACNIVKDSLEKVEILRRSSLIKTQDEWYKGPMAGDRHWPALHGFLQNEKGWGNDTIASIDETSSEVVSLLADPAKEQFRCRGLVVGYVQSGKTANMTAVIAKAVDAGYNLIVLLGGMTNKLRAQTQRRLDQDIVDRYRDFWQLYTTADKDGDFLMPANRSFTRPVKGRAQLVVMKKITSRLNSFHNTIMKTPTSTLRQLKVLLLDDECDQASVNSSRDEYDMTKINEAIRKIITSLPAVSYVGYTATPFANVFIDPFPHNKGELDDLYPEDFITALPRPDGYFGAREVFGPDPEDADDETSDEAGRDMIRIIPEDELERLRPARASDKDTFHPEITESLEHAILWFLASCAIRRMRGQANKHMTMLVHTSPYVIQHQYMADAIGRWIEKNGPSLRDGVGDIYERFSKLTIEELQKVSIYESQVKRPSSSDELLNVLGIVLDTLELAVENGTIDDEQRLDYEGHSKIYIVVGGAVLARGLTLEGLCVSFFLRTAKQYDTLLQMGRWFGFRQGYEDLPRLWTTAELASNFRALSHIEEEIREDISVYKERKTTPLEFAVKVRSIPGMAITAATKMKNAYRTSISFEGRHVQTIRFDHKDDDIVIGNWNAASDLINKIMVENSGDDFGSRRLFRNVPSAYVRQFLMQYSISPYHMDLKKDHLLSFIDGAAEKMPLWNVGVLTPVKKKESKRSTKPLGKLGQVMLVNRSKLAVPDVNFADIKALMSMSDVLIDADTTPGEKTWASYKAQRPSVPLLLLYPIDKDSKSERSKNRTDLDAINDLIGIAIIFPGQQDRSGNFYQVTLDTLTPEDLDEEEMFEDVDADGGELINE